MTTPPSSAGLAALRDRHVLLGVSGGIAAYKAAALARLLRRAGATVQVVMTASATRFVGTATFAGLTGRAVGTDVFDDAHLVPHVRYAREAQVAVFAPATADLLARFAHGFADDVVSASFTCLTVPTVIAPAMHTEMWEHPATRANVALLAERGAIVVGPDEGQLAGGDEGPGRLVEPDVLARAVADALGPGGASLAGRRVLVTAGGTREALDPVRYLTNRSSGKMGHALAAEAARRGAEVVLVTASRAVEVPPGVRPVAVESARDMHRAVQAEADGTDVIVKAAAVADVRPAREAAEKLKKSGDDLTAIPLVANPDILAELGARGRERRSRGEPTPLLVGFAAETTDEEAGGRAKLAEKGLDAIVVNRVGGDDAGFDVDTNRVVVLTADGTRADLGLGSKTEIARSLWDLIGSRLGPAPPSEEDA